MRGEKPSKSSRRLRCQLTSPARLDLVSVCDDKLTSAARRPST